MKRVHHRAHLRSPVNRSVFFTDGVDVKVGEVCNISGGGLLLKHEDYLPTQEEISFLTCVPRTPHLKNFEDNQLYEYDLALFPSAIIRVKGNIVRKFENPDDKDRMFMGVKFTEISDEDETLVQSFADKAASNVSYLQAMIDSSAPEMKVLKIAEILGYSTDLKVKDLTAILAIDLMSLKWN